MRVDSIEMMVQNYPENFEGWHLIRLEYGGHAEYCLKECVLWIPPNANVEELEELFKKWQKEE